MQRLRLQFFDIPYFDAAWFVLLRFTTLLAVSTGIVLGFRVGPGSLQ